MFLRTYNGWKIINNNVGKPVLYYHLSESLLSVLDLEVNWTTDVSTFFHSGVPPIVQSDHLWTWIVTRNRQKKWEYILLYFRPSLGSTYSDWTLIWLVLEKFYVSSFSKILSVWHWIVIRLSFQIWESTYC